MGSEVESLSERLARGGTATSRRSAAPSSASECARSSTAGEFRREATEWRSSSSPLAAALGKSGDALRDPKRARCSERFHVGKLCMRQSRARSRSPSRSRAREAPARACR